MNPLIIAGALAGIPVLLALVFRVSAVFVFLSVAAGGLLVQMVGDDANLAAGMVVHTGNIQMITNFVLLLLPLVLTLLFMRKTLPTSKLPLHIVPLVATSLALAILALPLLPSQMQQQILNGPHGDTIDDVKDVVVAGAAVMTLLLTWLTGRHKEHKAGKH
jgi:hypothetical protein